MRPSTIIALLCTLLLFVAQVRGWVKEGDQARMGRQMGASARVGMQARGLAAMQAAATHNHNTHAHQASTRTLHDWNDGNGPLRRCSGSPPIPGQKCCTRLVGDGLQWDWMWDLLPTHR